MSAATIGAILAGAAVVAAARARGLERARRSVEARSPSARPLDDRYWSRPPRPRPPAAGPVTVVVLVGVLVLALGLGGPGLAVGTAAALIGGRAQMLKRRRQVAVRVADEALPDLIDLLTVASAAGHPVRWCVEAVSARPPGALGGPLADVGRRLRRGDSLAATLRRVAPELGAMGPDLVEALLSSYVSGAPLTPVLERLAATTRDARRRSAEERARRLPVALLVPLVCCVLPAFALLAVVPLLAGSLGSLRP